MKMERKTTFHIDLFKEVLTDYVPCEKELNEFEYMKNEDDQEIESKGALKYFSTDKRFVMQKTVSHRRRKYVFGELYFFMKTKDMWINLNCVIVIYIGMSVNRHILYLWSLLERAGLMSKFEWHIYDKEEFHVDVVKYANLHRENVKLFDEYFTEETAEFYSKKKTLLISDLRSKAIAQTMYKGPKSREEVQKFTHSEMDEMNFQLLKSNEMNKNIYLKLKPLYASIRFTLPAEFWPKVEPFYEFIKGKLLFQPWNGFLEQEVRVITNSREIMKYDTIKFAKQGYFHNFVTRLCSFKTDKPEYRDYCPCWACTYECSILIDFHKAFNIPYSKNNFYEETSAIIDELIGRKLYWEWTYETGRTMEG